MISVCLGSVRPDTVGHTIAAVRRQTYQNWELIVVTQGQDARLVAEVRRAAGGDPRARTVQVATFGRSRALNTAMERARGDLFAFTDDDCEPEPDWLEVIAACFSREPRVGVVAGDLLAPPRRRFGLSTCPAAHTVDCLYRPADTGYVAPRGFYFVGGNLAVRRSVVELVGPFDPYLGTGTTFPACEDVDFGLRCEGRDVWMLTTPRSAVRHTYGRRAGARQVLRQHRAYALGMGALSGKLSLMGHRLASSWSGRASMREMLLDNIGQPLAAAKLLYQSSYVERARSAYLEQFELDDRLLSTPRLTGPIS